MKRIIMLAILSFAAVPAHKAYAAHYSKLGIVAAAKAAGKWDKAKVWIAENGFTDEWQAAAYFSDDYPLFATVTNMVVASGLATRAEVDAFLSAALDKAPDALLAAVYARDMQTAAGRRRWHGGFTSRFETNESARTIRRIDRYEDGYEHEEPGAVRQYLTPAEAAARAARRKSATLDDRIAAIRESIARLEAARTGSTNDLEAAHATIQLAAKRKILLRLESSKTNEVSVVVQP